MKKRFLVLFLLAVLSPAFGGVSGSISVASDDLATIYGVESPTGEFRRYWAPAGTFCGISRFSDLLNFLWTGWMTGGEVLFLSTLPGIYAFSCINPAGPREVLLYSYPALVSREADKQTGSLPEDQVWVDALTNALAK